MSLNFGDKTSVSVRALILGEHLELRALETAAPLGQAPLVIAARWRSASWRFPTGAAETVLNLLQHKSGLRVVWYIVALIVFEIAILLYDMFGRK